MRVCHGFTAEFDDPNLVSCAGLGPVLQLAERAGLQDLVAGHVRIDKPGGGNARLKVPALVAGMIEHRGPIVAATRPSRNGSACVPPEPGSTVAIGRFGMS